MGHLIGEMFIYMVVSWSLSSKALRDETFADTSILSDGNSSTQYD